MTRDQVAAYITDRYGAYTVAPVGPIWVAAVETVLRPSWGVGTTGDAALFDLYLELFAHDRRPDVPPPPTEWERRHREVRAAELAPAG